MKLRVIPNRVRGGGEAPGAMLEIERLAGLQPIRITIPAPDPEAPSDSAAGRLSAIHSRVTALADDYAVRLSEIETDENLSPKGMAETQLKATDALSGALAKLGAEVERELGSAQERLDKLPGVDLPDPLDQYAATVDASLRQVVREMKEKAGPYLRSEADLATLAAVLRAPPLLSGISERLHCDLSSRFRRARHGDTFEAAESDVSCLTQARETLTAFEDALGPLAGRAA